MPPPYSAPRRAFCIMTALRCSLPLVALFLAASACFASESAVNGIAAIVNGKVITKSEVADAVAAQRQMIAIRNRDNPMQAQREMAELEKTALDSLVDRELVLSEFGKLGGTIKSQYVDDDINTLIREQFKGDRDGFVVELAKTGMTMKKFRDLREKMIIVQVMRSKHGGHQAPPTPKQVDEYYKLHEDRWRDKDMLKISTITLPKFTSEPGSSPEKQRKLAEEIRAKVVAGADFGSMAKTYSQDSRAENKGEWDWMERKLMKPSMADAAFALKDGGVSPVIEDEAAFIIIYLDAKKLGKLTPLETVRGDIEKMISAEQGKDSVDEWLAALRKKATIRKF
ncbi:MAG: Peptidylprolyl isomerase [Verrucomicrobiaceae bacterium]|nr:Peptidylprolyl isomerase [Verrucomicrobiaceae bacterium]